MSSSALDEQNARSLALEAKLQPSNTSLRVQICELLADILLTDPDYAHEHQIPDRLWRQCFYDRIRRLRKEPAALQTILKEAHAFYEYLGAKITHPEPVVTQLTLQRGDVCRYQQDWERALAHYTAATQRSPHYGHAWNQKAVLLTQMQPDRPLEAYACYVRSLWATQPFPTAQANLDRLIATTQVPTHPPMARFCAQVVQSGDWSGLHTLTAGAGESLLVQLVIVALYQKQTEALALQLLQLPKLRFLPLVLLLEESGVSETLGPALVPVLNRLDPRSLPPHVSKQDMVDHVPDYACFAASSRTEPPPPCSFTQSQLKQGRLLTLVRHDPRMVETNGVWEWRGLTNDDDDMPVDDTDVMPIDDDDLLVYQENPNGGPALLVPGALLQQKAEQVAAQLSNEEDRVVVQFPAVAPPMSTVVAPPPGFDLPLATANPFANLTSAVGNHAVDTDPSFLLDSGLLKSLLMEESPQTTRNPFAT